MKIKDILAQERPSVSFEVFPPRKDAPFEPVKDAVAQLAQEQPSFMSVTYGASGNAQANTATIASFVQACGVPALAHLTCLTATRESIESEADALRRAGIENVLCLRGDLPKDASEPPPGNFSHAVDLVRALHGSGFCLGGACYPECHPESENKVSDMKGLKAKVDAGAEVLVSQLFFENQKFYDFQERCRIAGIEVPLIPGIMPVINANQIKRMISLCNASFPERFCRIIRRYENNSEALFDAGMSYCLSQIIDLIADGIPGIHLYTMNNPKVARRICDGIRNLV